MNVARKLLAAIADDNTLGSETVRLLSLLFLSIAALLSLAEYTREKEGASWPAWAGRAIVAAATTPPLTTTWWAIPPAIKENVLGRLWPSSESETKPGTKFEPIRFRPGFQEGVLALALVVPLYLRGLLKWKESFYSIISFSLILLVFASFVTIALASRQGQGIDPKVSYSIVAAIILSWAGIRSIAGASWLVALASAVYSLQVNSVHLGFCGFVYIACASLGLILHSGLNPGQFFQGLIEEYAPTVRRAGREARDDVTAFGESVGSAAKSVLDHMTPLDR